MNTLMKCVCTLRNILSQIRGCRCSWALSDYGSIKKTILTVYKALCTPSMPNDPIAHW